MVSIYGVVHRLGFLKFAKETKVIYIYKKRPVDNPSDFRQLYLLNIMYKLYLGSLAKKLISIPEENNWLSVENNSQQGFWFNSEF